MPRQKAERLTYLIPLAFFLFFMEITPPLKSAEPKSLTLGIATETTSLDPYFHTLSSNNQVMRHIFDPLIRTGPDHALLPGLATSWSIIDPTTWELNLRRDVTFHDGSAFNADDVIASLTRAVNVPNSPAGFAPYLRDLILKKIDPYTIHILTPQPNPNILNHVGSVSIISEAYRNASSADFNTGTALIGTGPYVFNAYLPAEGLTFKKNSSYWGPSPAWDSVTLKPIPSGTARVAALLSGSVDAIDFVSPIDLPRLIDSGKFRIAMSESDRIIYLHLDQWRQKSPYVSNKKGEKINNPLRNPTIRRALSLAIDREEIVARVSHGAATPAHKLAPDFIKGTQNALTPIPYRLLEAKRLLTDAGFQNGFALTIHGPNGRYPNDVKILGAITQFWSRLGLKVMAESIPVSSYFRRASSGAKDGSPEFSVLLGGWSSASGNAYDVVRSLVMTHDPKSGDGVANRGRYSNKKVDALMKRASATINPKKRDAFVAQAMEIALKKVAVIPLYFPKNAWAAKKSLRITPRSDEYTLAESFSPARL